jgi:hypothetical protein
MGQESRAVLCGYLIFKKTLQLQSYENLEMKDSGFMNIFRINQPLVPVFRKLSELKRAIFLENCVYIS